MTSHYTDAPASDTASRDRRPGPLPTGLRATRDPLTAGASGLRTRAPDRVQQRLLVLARQRLHVLARRRVHVLGRRPAGRRELVLRSLRLAARPAAGDGKPHPALPLAGAAPLLAAPPAGRMLDGRALPAQRGR